MNVFDESFLICPRCGFFNDDPNRDNKYYLPPGTILKDQYFIGVAIKAGGFGIIYKAWDRLLDKMVAVKEYYHGTLMTRTPGTTKVVVEPKYIKQYEKEKARFLYEARTVAKFNAHPNVVSVSDYFESCNTAYMVMEFLEGHSFEEYVRGIVVMPEAAPTVTGQSGSGTSGPHRSVSGGIPSSSVPAGAVSLGGVSGSGRSGSGSGGTGISRSGGGGASTSGSGGKGASASVPAGAVSPGGVSGSGAAVARNHVSVDFALRVTRSILDALEAVHKERIIHRDIKPGNIFITRDGTVKLLDFGAAMIEDTPDIERILTPCYAPPEQYRLDGKQRPYTDIYALGVTAYYALTGVKPDEATVREEKDEVRDVAELNPDVPPAVNNAIMRAMSVNPLLRFQNVAEFRQALASEKPVRTTKEEIKHRKWLHIAEAAGVAAALCILALTAFFVFRSRQNAAMLDPAQIEVWMRIPAGMDAAEAQDAFARMTQEFCTDFDGAVVVRSHDPEAWGELTGHAAGGQGADGGSNLGGDGADNGGGGHNITIYLTLFTDDEYENAITWMIEEGFDSKFVADGSIPAPNLFESTGLLRDEYDLDTDGDFDSLEDVYKRLKESGGTLFLDDYEDIYPDMKFMPTGFQLPVIYASAATVEEEGGGGAGGGQVSGPGAGTGTGSGAGTGTGSGAGADVPALADILSQKGVTAGDLQAAGYTIMVNPDAWGLYERFLGGAGGGLGGTGGGLGGAQASEAFREAVTAGEISVAYLTDTGDYRDLVNALGDSVERALIVGGPVPNLRMDCLWSVWGGRYESIDNQREAAMRLLYYMLSGRAQDTYFLQNGAGLPLNAQIFEEFKNVYAADFSDVDAQAIPEKDTVLDGRVGTGVH
ncbi:MAG: serine/threonine protein kinase [Lachnospiraceae bacterium]|nr:serine/threonine protein kinase [Lachnospiraceae bacterium]